MRRTAVLVKNTRHHERICTNSPPQAMGIHTRPGALQTENRLAKQRELTHGTRRRPQESWIHPAQTRTHKVLQEWRVLIFGALRGHAKVQKQNITAERHRGVQSTHNLCTKEGAAIHKLASHGAGVLLRHTDMADTASIAGVCSGVQDKEHSRREGERADSIRRLHPISRHHA